ncbi:MAG: hypothetical protein ACE1S7_07900, partial [Candidatus Tisiphia sp.]
PYFVVLMTKNGQMSIKDGLTLTSYLHNLSDRPFHYVPNQQNLVLLHFHSLLNYQILTTNY